MQRSATARRLSVAVTTVLVLASLFSASVLTKGIASAHDEDTSQPIATCETQTHAGSAYWGWTHWGPAPSEGEPTGEGEFASGGEAVSSTPQWLHVEGNRIVNESGQTVILRGVNIESREWMWSSGPTIAFERRAIPKATAAQPDGWGANTVLLAISSGPVVRNDTTYLAHLDELVALAKSNGAYTLLVYRTPEPNTPQPNMPDRAAQDALARLAARYENEPALIYGLQVEPHDVAWSTLVPRFTSMIDAIRANNPKALIAVPGTHWGRYIHWALDNPIPRENLIYKSHVYDSWDAVQQRYNLGGVAKRYPVILGEFGAGTQMNMDGVVKLLDLAEATGISWVGWLFYNKACPCLLSDVNTFAPSAYGAEVIRRLKP